MCWFDLYTARRGRSGFPWICSLTQTAQPAALQLKTLDLLTQPPMPMLYPNVRFPSVLTFLRMLECLFCVLSFLVLWAPSQSRLSRDPASRTLNKSCKQMHLTCAMQASPLCCVSSQLQECLLAAESLHRS